MNTREELFALLAQEHGITPLESELDDIIAVCRPYYAAEIARLEAEKAELLEGLCGIARLFDSALGKNKTSGAISVLLEKYRN